MESFNFIFFGRTFSLAWVTGIIFLVSIFFNMPKYTNIEKKPYFIFPLILYIFLLTIISIININEFSSQIIDQTFLLNVIMFIILTNYFSTHQGVGEKALVMFMLGALFTSILSFNGFGVEVNTDGRVSWFDGSPIKMSFEMVAALFIANSTKINSKIYRWLLYSLSIFLIIFVFQSGSRGPFLIMIIGLLAIIYFKIVKKSNILPTILIFTFIGSFLILSDLMSERISSILTTKSDLNNGALGGRLYLWTNFIKIIIDNIIVGSGLSGVALEKYKMLGYVPSSHNLFLQILLDTGIIGFLFYFTFILSLWLKSYSIYRVGQDYRPILLFIVMFGFMVSIHPNNAKVFWLLAAYIASYPLKKFFLRVKQ